MTKNDICNLALSHLGVGTTVSDIDTELSAEAKACVRFYDTALEIVLRDFAWPFSTRTVSPSLVEEDPTTEWGYSYRYPAGCLKIRRILSGTRNDTVQSKIRYRVTGDDSGRLIYTDCDAPVVEYTKLIADVDDYSSDFVMALSYRMAHYVAPRLTGGDPFDLQRKMLNFYLLEITNAEANASNEEQYDEEPYSEFERSRW